MWRAGTLIRSQHSRVLARLLLARGLENGQASSIPVSRLFSTGSRDQEAGAAKPRVKSFPAPDMEFFNELLDDSDDDDDDDEAGIQDKEYRQKQEEIQRELDTRIGRPWTDPWEITQEDWMSTGTADDLPEWSPDYVSRVAQERVKLHPGRYTCRRIDPRMRFL
jgi:hypothetical protein